MDERPSSDNSDFASQIMYMHDVQNPANMLQHLLDDDYTPQLLVVSLSKIHPSGLPMTYIYDHHLRNPVAMIDGDSSGKQENLTTRVVCKVAFTCAGKDKLRKEAKFYEHPLVTSLHGKEIPRYFGLYQSTEASTCRWV